jgi:phosphoribosylanthranilate isomerase
MSDMSQQRVRVKICGVTCAEDVAVAVEAGADAVGFNFYSQSPRYVSPQTARELTRSLPPFVEAVGVFVKHSVAQARAFLGPIGRIWTIQVHGGEAETLDAHPWRYVPAFAVREKGDLDRINEYLDRCRRAGTLPSAALIDGHAPGLHGGTGRTAPWELLKGVSRDVPLILAGGLTPDNVADAVRAVRPFAVDVASGVESSPGRKDADKVRQFIEQVRRAE